MRIRHIKRAKKLEKLVKEIINNLGDDDKEILINTVGVIKTISSLSIINLIKRIEDRSSKQENKNLK